jgi:hypothetical protein
MEDTTEDAPDETRQLALLLLIGFVARLFLQDHVRELGPLLAVPALRCRHARVLHLGCPLDKVAPRPSRRGALHRETSNQLHQPTGIHEATVQR